MPELNQIDTRLSPEQMAQTQRAADEVNKKNKIEGKHYGETLGKDSFLKLLLTELQHQDPTAPMQDKEFIAQMAQFSSLEQMNNISAEMKSMNARSGMSEAYAMIGKKIQAFDPQTNRVTEGNVTHIKRDGDRVFLMVGNTAVDPNNVSAVYPADPESSDSNRSINSAPANVLQYNTPESNVQNTSEKSANSTPADISRARSAYQESATETNTKGGANKLINFSEYYDNKKDRK